MFWLTVVENIIVLAKAIPAISPMHGEITCVAGIAEDETWRRLHPVPTNLLGQSYFKKFDVINVELDLWKGQHPRPEDRFLVNYNGRVKEIADWEQRRSYLSKFLDTSINSILSSGRSLGIIKPNIIDFYKDRNERCRYKFIDADGIEYDLVCREWETSALAAKYPTNFDKVHVKFCDWMKERDTYFVIGTTADNVTKMGVAVHYPPKRT